MAISKLGGTGSDNWELISSVTPTVSTSAVNFTGLSPYRKLMVTWSSLILSSANYVNIRLNNDSANKYNFFATTGTGATVTSTNVDQFTYGDGTFANANGAAIFTSCDNAGVKFMENGFHSPALRCYYYGYYLASAVITQVNFLGSSTFTATGTVSLYGVK